MHLFRPRHLLRLAAILAALAPGARAMAQAPTLPEAKNHLERGLRYFNVQSYSEAIEEFRQGYEMEPAPDFLYALAQAQRLSGDCAKAILSYQAFLRSRPSEKRAAAAQQNIARCKEEARQPAPAEAPSPGPPPVTPSAPTTEPSPAPPVVTAEPPEPKASPALTPAPTTNVEEGSPWYRDSIGDGLALLGGATLVTGVVLLEVGASGVSSANSKAANATDYSTVAAAGASARQSNSLQTAGAGIAIAGGAIAGAAVVRFLIRSPELPAASVTVLPGGGAAVLAGGTF